MGISCRQPTLTSSSPMTSSSSATRCKVGMERCTEDKLISQIKPSLDLEFKFGQMVRSTLVTGEMEKVFPMDILPMQLLKECMAGNIEKMESLGIYEVAPEDFSLIDYSSSSKIEAQYIIRQGLDLMISEVG